MAVQSRLLKIFKAILGLDLRTSDLLRSQGAATVINNMDFRSTGAINKRKGFQTTGRPGGGYGTTSFDNTNISTGDVTKELISTDDDLHKYTAATFPITYTGSTSASYFVYLDTATSTFKFKLVEDNATVLDYDMGTGKELSFITVTTLIAAINAVTNFTCTGSGTEPCAFIPIQNDIPLPASVATSVAYDSFVAVTTPGTYTTPFSAHYADRNGANFENATFATLNNVLYISNGYDDLHKYDGTRVYKAGLPQGELASVAAGAAGVPNSTYFYKVTYEYTDGKSNFIESQQSAAISVVLANQRADIVVDNILDASGYDVDSSTLKINIYRTKAGSTEFDTYYLVTALTNNGATATQAYTDNLADTALGIQYIEPLISPQTPPKGRYIDVWRGQIIISGKRDAVNTTYFSDILQAENFPVDNNFLIEGRSGSKITGIGTLDNTLYAFKNDTIFSVTGELPTFNFVVDNVSREGVGCIAHASIQEVNGELWFLNDTGVFAISPKGLSEPSTPIEPKFAFGHGFDLKKAVAFRGITTRKYMLFLPTTSSVAGNLYTTSASRTLVYDTFREAWLEWTNFNFMGGAALIDDVMFNINRDFDSAGGSVKEYVNRVHNTGTTEDYSDHTTAITFQYKSNWEALNEPSIFKKHLRVKVHSLDATINTFESDSFILTVKTEHDYNDSTISSLTMDFSGGSEGWGVSEWGTSTWGDIRITSLKSKLASRKAKAIRFVFENSTVNENILISGYEVEIAAPYSSSIKE
jgi:hypothetical protein